MKLLETKYEKRSFFITALIHVLLVLIMIFFGFSYLDPPPQAGIAISFGTAEMGSGVEQPEEPVRAAPQQTVSEVTPVEENLAEEVVTQEQIEAPVVQEKEKETVVTEKKKPEKKPEEPVKKPEPDQATRDALSSLINAPEQTGQEKSGEGTDATAGDQGRLDGSTASRKYYGNAVGLDGDGNYRLGGRRALNKEKFVQDCNESGIVVVRIEVNRNGRVIRAVPGIKGTTNNAACLTEPAKRAALATRFNSDPEAPAVQVGTIIYDFKLSE